MRKLMRKLISKLSVFWISLLAFGFDRASKHLMVDSLDLGVAYSWLPGLEFKLAYNYGVAFGIGSQGYAWQFVFFVALAFMASLLLILWIVQTPVQDRLFRVSLALILGGAIGNLFDRLVYGYIIDFIFLHYKSFSFPVFNLADSFIFIGVALILVFRRARLIENNKV